MTDHQAGGTTVVVTAAEIENVLITSAGAAPDVFEGSRHVPLEELGLDSLAVLELEAVIADRYGLKVPDGAVALSVDQIVAELQTAGAVG
ncbi:acyl carrier protein [Kitasatospora sp. NPDC058032]|uniref:acyl carrier protein n=1 Tax=unclassified Kitasatospora TaxID=2633591 RepID=UPI00339E6A96